MPAKSVDVALERGWRWDGIVAELLKEDGELGVAEIRRHRCNIIAPDGCGRQGTTRR